MRLQLEGADLEGLLARVNEEYGATARIVDAEKVRSGGIGGFFAREHFAMTVEVDDEPALFTADDVPDSAAALLGLADAVEDQRVSTTGDNFSTMLRSLIATTGSAEEVEEPAEEAEFQPLVAPRAKSAKALKAAANAAAFAPAATITAPPVATPAAPAPAVATPTLAAPAVAAPARARTVAAPAPAAPLPVVEPMPASVPAPVPAGKAKRTTAADRDRALLRKLGLPKAMMPAPGRAALHHRIAAAIPDLPFDPFLPPAPGEVQVVIGERSAALEVADLLAEAWGFPADSVLLVADRADLSAVPASQSVWSAHILHTKHASAHRRGLPLLVAVDAEFAVRNQRDARWPAGIAAFLAHTHRLGVVPATAKAEDIAYWAHRLGGVDALALVDVDETASPATALATNIPVVLLDDRPATGDEWAALLCARAAELS